MADILERGEKGALALVGCTLDAIEYIAENLRPKDAEEVYATCGHRRYADAIALSVANSEDCGVVVSAYGEPLGIVGVSTLSLIYNTGNPWMLATTGADRYKRAFIEWGIAYTADMLRHYANLVNHVDARNTKSVAWLQHLGYRLSEPEPYGALGMPFRRFEKRGSLCA